MKTHTLQCADCDYRLICHRTNLGRRRPDIHRHWLRRHTTNNRRKELICDECDRSCNGVYAMWAHIRNRHLTRSADDFYTCDHCLLQLFQRPAILQHLIDQHGFDHTAKRRFECDVCGYVNGCKWTLGKHAHVHLPTSFHKCTICTESFASISGLNRHRRRRHGRVVFACDECGKDYAKRAYVHQHLLTAHAVDETTITDIKQEETRLYCRLV